MSGTPIFLNASQSACSENLLLNTDGEPTRTKLSQDRDAISPLNRIFARQRGRLAKWAKVALVRTVSIKTISPSCARSIPVPLAGRWARDLPRVSTGLLKGIAGTGSTRRTIALARHASWLAAAILLTGCGASRGGSGRRWLGSEHESAPGLVRHPAGKDEHHCRREFHRPAPGQ